jgi:hypothetical protein
MDFASCTASRPNEQTFAHKLDNTMLLPSIMNYFTFAIDHAELPLLCFNAATSRQLKID